MPGPFRRRKGRFTVSLGTGERELLAELCRQSRELLEEEDPSSDPSIARLFPAAYKDDPLRSLEFETNLGDSPRAGKLAAIDTLERTVDSSELTEEELLTWMGAVNDFRCCSARGSTSRRSRRKATIRREIRTTTRSRSTST